MLRGHAQGTIEFARRIFPGNGGRQFHNLVIAVERTKACKKIIADIAAGYRHAVGVLERDPFGGIVKVTGRIAFQSFYLFIRNAQLAAHGSI